MLSFACIINLFVYLGVLKGVGVAPLIEYSPKSAFVAFS